MQLPLNLIKMNILEHTGIALFLGCLIHSVIGDESNPVYRPGSYGYEEPIPSPSESSKLFKIHEPEGPNTYKFGYDTGKGNPARQFREERMDLNGAVHGRYGLVDQWGRLRVTQYISDKGGYRVLKTSFTTPDQLAQINGHQIVAKPAFEASDLTSVSLASNHSTGVITSDKTVNGSDFYNGLGSTAKPMDTDVPGSLATITTSQPLTTAGSPDKSSSATSASTQTLISSSSMSGLLRNWVPSAQTEDYVQLTTQALPTLTTTTKVPFSLRIPFDKPPTPFTGPVPPFARKDLHLNNIQYFESSRKTKPRRNRKNYQMFDETSQSRAYIKPDPVQELEKPVRPRNTDYGNVHGHYDYDYDVNHPDYIAHYLALYNQLYTQLQRHAFGRRLITLLVPKQALASNAQFY